MNHTVKQKLLERLKSYLDETIEHRSFHKNAAKTFFEMLYIKFKYLHGSDS